MRFFPASVLVVVAAMVSACPPAAEPDGGTRDAGGTTDGGPSYVNLLPDQYESAYGRAIAVAGGKVYVAGNAIRTGTTSNNDFFVARFNQDLTRDTSFGTDGVALATFDGGTTISVPFNNDSALDLFFDQDKPVVVGSVRAFTIGTGDLGLARFTADGQLDGTFGTGGLRADGFGRPSYLSHALPFDGGYLVSGAVDNGVRQGDVVVLRYTGAGAVDVNFSNGSGAGAVLDFGFNQMEEARGLVVQGDKVVVGGGQGFGLGRLLPSGQLDLSFGPNGTGLLTNGPGLCAAFLQRADGSLWLVGNVELNRDGGPGIEANFLKQVRLTPDGLPLPGFGDTNGRRADFIEGFGAPRGAALQADGKLVIYFAYLARTWLVRLDTNGNLNTTFGTNGLREVGFTLPLLEGNSGKGNHLVIDGNTAWVTDIDLVDSGPSSTRQVLGLAKVAL